MDFESDRRELVIQYVFDKYGRENAAQVANVISYRPKNAVRDMAKAFGASPGQQDAWSKQVERYGALVSTGEDHDIPPQVVDLALQVMKFPRHLGIHSGGMVLTDRPVGEVVPIEHARMDKRTVIQWDKDDCAWMGLVKFDLLGLGMLSAIQYTFDLVRDTLGEEWTLVEHPAARSQGVYDQLCRADSVGVFQVESRAQMGLLPRLQPRKFYDLVVEIALIRPGPDPGRRRAPVRAAQARPGAGHLPAPEARRNRARAHARGADLPGAAHADRDGGRRLHRRRCGHCCAARWGPSAGSSGSTRCATSSMRGWRPTASTVRMPTRSTQKIQAFAGFGFAESHALSFALLVYASRVVAAALPGGVPRGAAAGAADGVLLAAVAHRRTRAATGCRYCVPTFSALLRGRRLEPVVERSRELPGEMAFFSSPSTCAPTCASWKARCARSWRSATSTARTSRSMSRVRR